MSRFATLFTGLAQPRLQEQLGQTVTFTAGGVASSVTAVVESRSYADIEAPDGIVRLHRLTLRFDVADCSPVRGNTVTYDGKVWGCEEVPEQTGSSVLAVFVHSDPQTKARDGREVRRGRG